MTFSNESLMNDYLSINRHKNHSEVKPSITIKQDRPKELKGIEIVCTRCSHKWLFISKKEHTVKPYMA
jgi:DNA-directed RNA polymerase subunit RPC12/RpoP